ncbi:MAG: hypothetical protein J7M24_01515 [Candidatus Latescibacteria bacterium]|nr:hypothetical protein [Candidatus Latescibacterota bacterium]
MNIMTSTYIWLVIFGISTVAFLVIAVWVIIRGGKDVWEILTMPESEIEKME